MTIQRALVFFFMMLFLGSSAWAADPSWTEAVGKATAGNKEWAPAIRIAVMLTVLAVLPSLVIAMTTFIRFIVVLSVLRQAIGMPETPPNIVLVTLAIFLSLFAMRPVLDQIDQRALTPYLNNQIPIEQALTIASVPIKEFMIRQTSPEDFATISELSASEFPQNVEQVKFAHLVPAFMMSELKTAFRIAFLIFLPFLMIDLIVAGTLMSLGMLMVPPATISLPIKLLVFVLVDGWQLIARSLVGGVL